MENENNNQQQNEQQNQNVADNQQNNNQNQNNNNQQQNNGSDNQNQNNADVEKAKAGAISDLLKSLGVDDEEALKGIVTKEHEDEEAKKTDLQKKDDALTATTKELVAERDARIMAEAKLAAIKLGANPELVDDLVIIAKAKVTKDKDINAVVAEIKESAAGKVYFTVSEEGEKGKPNKKNVTRTRPHEKDKDNSGSDDEGGEGQHSGSMAARILANRKKPTKHYFK